MFWGLRAVESVVLDENKNAIGISRKMFNHAHPAMVVPAISVGDRIEIEGMQSEPLIFEVPNLQMAVTWFCGREQGEVPLSIDGLFVWTDQRKVVITRRTRFRYPFRPNEPRRATLRARSRRDS
jgi:hypothetical protein